MGGSVQHSWPSSSAGNQGNGRPFQSRAGNRGVEQDRARWHAAGWPPDGGDRSSPSPRSRMAAARGRTASCGGRSVPGGRSTLAVPGAAEGMVADVAQLVCRVDILGANIALSASMFGEFMHEGLRSSPASTCAPRFLPPRPCCRRCAAQGGGRTTSISAASSARSPTPSTRSTASPRRRLLYLTKAIALECVKDGIEGTPASARPDRDASTCKTEARTNPRRAPR